MCNGGHILSGYATVEVLAMFNESAFDSLAVLIIVIHAVACISSVNYILYYKHLLTLEFPYPNSKASYFVVYNIEAISAIHFFQAVADPTLMFVAAPANALRVTATVFTTVFFTLHRYHVASVYRKWETVTIPENESVVGKQRVHAIRVVSSDMLPISCVVYCLSFPFLNYQLFVRSS